MAERVCYSLHVAVVAKRRMRRMPKTDFLKQPDMTCSPAPTFLANSTLETYSQAESRQTGPADRSGRVPRHVKLHRLPRQRGGLSENRVESEGRQTEPEPVGFHVHAGKGAVGRPASINRYQLDLMIGRALWAHTARIVTTSRPGAASWNTTADFHAAPCSPARWRRLPRRPSLPVRDTAYAAGPDVNSPQDMMAFLLLSEALTGVNRQLLAPELRAQPERCTEFKARHRSDQYQE